MSYSNSEALGISRKSKASFWYNKPESAKEVKRKNALKKGKRIRGCIRQSTRKKFFAEFSNCFYCNIELTEENRTIDHFIPLSKGGSNSEENWRASCKLCNHEKGDKTNFVSGVVYG